MDTRTKEERDAEAKALGEMTPFQAIKKAHNEMFGGMPKRKNPRPRHTRKFNKPAARLRNKRARKARRKNRK